MSSKFCCYNLSERPFNALLVTPRHGDKVGPLLVAVLLSLHIYIYIFNPYINIISFSQRENKDIFIVYSTGSA